MKYREITRTELAEIIKKHELWLNGKDGGEKADLSYCTIKKLSEEERKKLQEETAADEWQDSTGWNDFAISNKNLSYANLEGAALSGALENVDLKKANAKDADLSECEFFENDMSGADFTGADMSCTIITDSNLEKSTFANSHVAFARISGCNAKNTIFNRSDLCAAYFEDCSFLQANFSGANMMRSSWRNCEMEEIDLTDAALQMANFEETNLKIGRYGCSPTTSMYALACPEEGSFVGFKKCEDDFILKLKITEDSKRSSATSRLCRCSKAEVLSITLLDGKETGRTELADENDIAYRLGETVEVENFDENRWSEKGNGILFFITREEAVSCRL